MSSLEREAQLFAQYLVGRSANSETVQLYESLANYKLDNADQKLLDYMRAHPWSIGLIDAGLVFYKPLSGARRHLYLMLAILESNKEYADLFLAKQRGRLYLLVVTGVGIRAIVRAILGIVLIKAIV